MSRCQIKKCSLEKWPFLTVDSIELARIEAGTCDGTGQTRTHDVCCCHNIATADCTNVSGVVLGLNSGNYIWVKCK